MPQTITPFHHAFTLLPLQSRLLDARRGLRLDVLQGCLWLTRPGHADDYFVVAGTGMELHEPQVLVQCEWSIRTIRPIAAQYRLVPLATRYSRALAR